MTDTRVSSGTSDPYAMTTANLRRRSQAVYLACEEAVAKDISNSLKWAADEIDRLRGDAQAEPVSPHVLADKIIADPTILHLRECGFQPAMRFESTLRAAIVRALALPSTDREGGVHFPGRDPTAGEII